MAFDIKYIITAVDEFSTVAKGIARSVSALGAKIGALGRKIHSAGEGMTRLGKGMMLRVTAPILAAGGAVLKASDDLENFRNRLASVGLTAEEQKKAYRSLTDFIVNSPFPSQSVEDGALALLKMNHNTKLTIDQLKMLGNISATTKADIGMLAGVLGRAGASSRGITQVFTTFGEYGIKIKDIMVDMAKATGHALTTEDIDKAIQQHKINIDIILAVLKKMTTGSGEFAGAMGKMANELGPLLGSFYFAAKSKILAPLGDAVESALHLKELLLAGIKYILDNQDKIRLWIETHKQLIKVISVMALFGALLAPVLITFGLIAISIGALLSPLNLILVILGAIGFMLVKHDAAINGWASALKDVIGFAHGLWVIFKDIFNIIYDAVIIIKDMMHILTHPFNLKENFKMLFNLPKELKGITIRHAFEAPKGIMDMFKGGVKLPSIGEGGNIIQKLLFGDLGKETAAVAKPLGGQQKSTLEIHVKDPAGIVKSVRGEGDHDLSMKVGTNMAHAM